MEPKFASHIVADRYKHIEVKAVDGRLVAHHFWVPTAARLLELEQKHRGFFSTQALSRKEVLEILDRWRARVPRHFDVAVANWQPHPGGLFLEVPIVQRDFNGVLQLVEGVEKLLAFEAAGDVLQTATALLFERG